MKDAVAIHLVTTEKKGDRTVRSDVEKFSSITAARADMRCFLRSWLDEGWERVPRPGAARKPPMQLSIRNDEGESFTCTIVVTTGTQRKLIPEPDLSE